MGERSPATGFLLQQLCIHHLSAKVKYFVYLFFRFAKSHAKRAYVPTCLRVSMVYVPTCLCASAVYAAICLRANLQKACQLVIWRTNMPINVHTACQCAKWHVDFSSIPLTKCYGKFLFFIIIKTFYIILDIIVIH